MSKANVDVNFKSLFSANYSDTPGSTRFFLVLKGFTSARLSSTKYLSLSSISPFAVMLNIFYSFE